MTGVAAAIALLSGLAVLLWGAVSLLALTIPLVVALALGAVSWSAYVEVPPDEDGRRGAIVVRITTGCSMLLLAFLLALTSARPGAGWLWLLVVLVFAGAIAVVVGPQLLLLLHERSALRTAQVRDEQRAEIAAHLHDSVLQTLALIQRQASSPREVHRLARGQERELRAWLYGPGGYGRPDRDDRPVDEQLSAALGGAAAEVEDTYAVTVNPVVVGDATMDPDLRALVLAAREAMVNAAKHSGVGEVSVYAEVEREPGDRGGEVNVFVRDRGAGFDPDSVDPDRHGLADSVRNRMERHGGTVRLRTAPGEGTEIRLTMPLQADGERAGAVTREGER
jgi:signal transduction histidine kinase